MGTVNLNNFVPLALNLSYLNRKAVDALLNCSKILVDAHKVRLYLGGEFMELIPVLLSISTNLEDVELERIEHQLARVGGAVAYRLRHGNRGILQVCDVHDQPQSRLRLPPPHVTCAARRRMPHKSGWEVGFYRWRRSSPVTTLGP